MFEFYISLISLGCIAGFSAGFFGVGGGAIVVPALSFLFIKQNLFSEHYMHGALATSLAIMIFTSTSSIIAHNKRGSIDWDIIKILSLGLILGTFLGSLISSYINSKFLTIFFSIFLFFISYKLSVPSKIKLDKQTISKTKITSLSGIIGFLSALLGIGGGTMTVPMLLKYKYNLKQSIAISSVCGLIIAISGVVGFLFSAKIVIISEQNSIGFVHIPSLITVAIFSTLFAPIGVRYAHTISENMAKKIFAIFLLIIAIKQITTLF